MSSRKTKTSSNIYGSKTSPRKSHKNETVSAKSKKISDPITLFGSESKPKKKITKKKIEDPVDFEDKIDNIIQALQENYIQQKKLMYELKELKTLHKKEIKR